jgi:hypothetical protein
MLTTKTYVIDHDQMEQFTRLAKARRYSVSELLRLAVSQFLEREDRPSKRASQK